MVYVVETRKPLNEILCQLPLECLIELQLNVNDIREVKQPKEVKVNVSKLQQLFANTN